MKVKWLGHSAFIITSDEGINIITDPYSTGMGINYGEIKEAADIVVVSHDHADHANTKLPGSPQVIKGTDEAKGIKFKGIAAYHDEAKGRQRGPNSIICFTVDGIKLCHLGDLGHQLTDEQAREIGEVDILMLPIGGVFTIDPKTATKVCDKLKPKVAIPMHYSTEKCAYPISGVEEFLKGKANVKRMDTSEAEFKKNELPSATEVVVLKHAL